MAKFKDIFKSSIVLDRKSIIFNKLRAGLDLNDLIVFLRFLGQYNSLCGYFIEFIETNKSKFEEFDNSEIALYRIFFDVLYRNDKSLYSKTILYSNPTNADDDFQFPHAVLQIYKRLYNHAAYQNIKEILVVVDENYRAYTSPSLIVTKKLPKHLLKYKEHSQILHDIVSEVIDEVKAK